MGLAQILSAVFGCLTCLGDGICRTEECRETSRILSENMISTKPEDQHMACYDFYNYACGNYPKKHPLGYNNHAQLMMEYHIKRIDDLLADLLDKPINKSDSDRIKEARATYKRCLRNYNRPNKKDYCLFVIKQVHENAVVELLADKLKGHRARDTVEEMLNNIKSSFISKIQNSGLIANRKPKAINEIIAVRSFIFYDDQMISSQVPEYVFDKFCKYHAEERIIRIPITMMTVPFFNFGLKSMEYGGLGFAIAHELAYIIDPPPVTEKRYGAVPLWNENRVRSSIQQYNRLPFGGRNENVNVNTKFLIENLADNQGFQIALDAFTNTHPGTEEQLIGFESFTSEQLLTLAFATVHCENVSNRYNRDTSFAPGPARVNGAVMNSSKFSEIWHCTETSPMNPKNKNDIWL